MRDSISPVFRLTQDHLDASDFKPLTEAISAGSAIDATDLSFNAEALAALRELLYRDPAGRPQFLGWRFVGSTFAADCDFSGCSFTVGRFDRCEFKERASFTKAVFTRASFRHACFGAEANFERVEFGTKADFHTARFQESARFSHARFTKAQFYAARLGEQAAFTRARFAGAARFHGTRFGARVSFTEVAFLALVDFGGAYFGEKAQLARASFGGSPDFTGASFENRARLTDWSVGGDLVMRSTHFLGAVSLHGGAVVGDAVFSYAEFEDYIDLGEFFCRGSAYFSSVAIMGASRIGPLHAEQAIDFGGAVVHSPCAFSLVARHADFSEARFLAPIQIAFGGGDLVLEHLNNGARLLLRGPRPVGVKMSPPRLLSLRGGDLGEVVISGFDVRPLHLAGAEGIDALRIESGIAFERAPKGPRTHREVIAEEHALRDKQRPESGWYGDSCRPGWKVGSSAVDRVELARIYRGLRKAREDMRDAPGAADFYYGEMEMRRLQARGELAHPSSLGAFTLSVGSYLLLELYRVLGGYGVRPGRPLAVFAAIALLAAGWVDHGDLIHHIDALPNHKSSELVSATFEQCLVFVLRSALLLPNSAGVVTSTGAEWLQIAARVLGPLLIGLFAFGLRARVHR